MTNLVVRRNAVRNVNPWKEMDKMINDFNNAYEAAPRKPVVHIENEENRVVLTAELPGFAAEDLDIQVKENLLTIQALERGEKKKDEDKVVFERSFVLPEDLQSSKIEAEMKHGLLTLELPRKEKPAPLAIKVKG
jgi:HSP20 family protein